MNIGFDISLAINTRRSARSFKMQKLNDKTLNEIKSYSNSIIVPFEHSTKVNFFEAEPTKVLYSIMNSPPNNVAFLSKTDVISISKTGFIGELIILFAQSIGISTCWYGHYNLAKLEELMPHLESEAQLKEANNGYGYSKGITEGIRAICISPLGYYEDKGLRLMDRITKSTISFKRKPIDNLLVYPNDYKKLSSDVLYALDLGRKAPSAANSQMWRFEFEDNYKTIIVAMPAGYKHFKWEHPNVDIGICACHIWLGLIDKGYNPRISVKENQNRALWKISI